MITNVLDIVVLTSCFLYAYLFFVAMYHVIAASYSTREQRILQALVVILVPLLGSIMMIAFHLSQYERPVPKLQSPEKPGSKLFKLLVLTAFVSGSGGIVSGAHGGSDSSDTTDFGGSDAGGSGD